MVMGTTSEYRMISSFTREALKFKVNRGTTAKEKPIETVNSEEFCGIFVDDILREKIRRGTEDLEAGRSISLKELKKKLL